MEIHHLHQLREKGGAGKASSLCTNIPPFGDGSGCLFPRHRYYFPRNTSWFKILASICMLFTAAFGSPPAWLPVVRGPEGPQGLFRLGSGSGSAPAAGREGGSSPARWFVFSQDQTRCLSRWLPTAHPPTVASAGGVRSSPRSLWPRLRDPGPTTALVPRPHGGTRLPGSPG